MCLTSYACPCVVKFFSVAFMYMYVCPYMCSRLYWHVHYSMCIQRCDYIHETVSVCVCVCVCVHVCVCVCLLCMCGECLVCVCVCVGVCDVWGGVCLMYVCVICVGVFVCVCVFFFLLFIRFLVVCVSLVINGIESF